MVSEYLKQQVLSATPDEIFILLLDKCIVLVQQEDINVNKIIEILDALLSMLNRDITNEFVNEVDAVLAFLIFEITKYNFKQDRKILDSITVILRNLSDAWSTRLKHL